MKAELITIGDELLIGQTVNTNANWLGRELTLCGAEVSRCNTIQDERSEIIRALDEALDHNDLVVVTGGLGPTRDDLTKETLSEYFDTPLVMREDVLERIKKYFESRDRGMLPSNVKQAELPKDCIVFENNHGTASGMWFERNKQVVVSIPGVPYEMKALMEESVIPKIKSFFSLSGLHYETLMTLGIEESMLADKIESWEDRIYEDGLSLAYLPSPGIVRLRLSSKRGAKDTKLINNYIEELERGLPKYAYGRNGETVYEVVGDLMRKEKAKLGSVESCTGGGIVKAFVEHSGASDFFQGSLVTYSNELKERLAGVDHDVLQKHGAVSQEVVEAMAVGGQKKLGVDYCVAVSGVAGPNGGSPDKPVGTVWVGVAHKKGVTSKKLKLTNHRGRNLEMTALYSVNFLRQIVLGIDLD